MTREEFQKLLDAYLDGSADPQQKKLLDDFFHTYDSDDLSIGDAAVRDNIWNKFKQNTSRSKKRISPSLQWTAIAASVTLFIFAVYFFWHNNTPPHSENKVASQQRTVETHRGQKIKMRLADGTSIVLNASSKITYPKKFSNETREIFLDGEAYFQVAHDSSKPFIVHTLQSNTRVLGTTFNIRAIRGSKTEITLLEGKVNVSRLSSAKSEPGPEVSLAPNQQAIIENESGTIVTREIDASRFMEWKDDIIRFNKTSLREAIPLLENVYDVDIEMENAAIGDCKISATYRRQALTHILKSIEYILGVKCDMQGKKIMIRGKSC